MTKLYCILTLALFSIEAFGLTIAVPSRQEMLRSADIVAVGTLEPSGNDWYLRVVQSLKGGGKPGEKLLFTPSLNRPVLSVPDLAKYMVGDRPFLLVGKFDTPSNSVQPHHSIHSIWPQGLPKDFPRGNLNEAVAFAAEALGVPAPDPLPDLEGDPPLPPEASAPPVRTPPAPAKPDPGRVVAGGQPAMEPPSKPLWIAGTASAAGLLLWMVLKKRR